MPWRVVERSIGSGVCRREWDRKYGPGRWHIGYLLGSRFFPEAAALEAVYRTSYEAHFVDHPADLEELIWHAGELLKPPAGANEDLELAVGAILCYLKSHELELMGSERLAIGGQTGSAAGPLSVRLNPKKVRVAGSAMLTLENFRERRRCLAVRE